MTQKLFLILICVSSVTGFAQTFLPITNLVTENLATNSAAVSTNSATPHTEADAHKLQSGDIVSFRIEEDREPATADPKLLVVSDSGELDVPYIGLLKVKEKTIGAATKEIRDLLAKDYYYDPHPHVGLTTSSMKLGRIYVYGEVKNPGVQPLPPNEVFTASKAIMSAGGFADFAKRTKVQVIRRSPGGNKIFTIDMDKFFEKGQTEVDVNLEPDDYILVPKRLWNP